MSVRALGWRGLARCDLGDAGGLDDLSLALDLARRQGLGRYGAMLYANLADELQSFRGPRAALRLRRKGLAFAGQRGDRMSLLGFQAGEVADLGLGGKWDAALALAREIDEPLVTAGQILDLAAVRSAAARILTARGQAAGREVQAFVDVGPRQGVPRCRESGRGARRAGGRAPGARRARRGSGAARAHSRGTRVDPQLPPVRPHAAFRAAGSGRAGRSRSCSQARGQDGRKPGARQLCRRAPCRTRGRARRPARAGGPRVRRGRRALARFRSTLRSRHRRFSARGAACWRSGESKPRRRRCSVPAACSSDSGPTLPFPRRYGCWGPAGWRRLRERETEEEVVPPQHQAALDKGR